MRHFLLLTLLAACSTNPGEQSRERDRKTAPTRQATGKAASQAKRPSRETKATRIVYRSYKKGATVFILENLAGRNLVRLRSQPLKAGHSPVAYVPDDVMERLLREFDRSGFSDYAVPRPSNPAKVGAVGELTIISENRARMVSLLRKRLPRNATPRGEDVKAARVYVKCGRNFVAVWNHYPPTMQATTSSGGKFGVKKANAR